MKIRSATFVKSAVHPRDFPSDDLPEVAFAGRSNVGKSSLMNALMERKSLVKVSGTPGRTQLLSWFEVNGSLRLCDLPGYGFARVPAHLRQSWGTMVNRYLGERTNLLAITILFDVRRGFEEDDAMLLEGAAKLGLHSILVATKCDKLSKAELFRRKVAIGRELGVNPDGDIVWTSATSRQGREELWRRIRQLLPREEAEEGSGD